VARETDNVRARIPGTWKQAAMKIFGDVCQPHILAELLAGHLMVTAFTDLADYLGPGGAWR
jgi:hypothetical protein